MICLECRHDNKYGVEVCGGCGIELLTIPPHAYSNHVCQMTLALREFLAGQLGRGEFLSTSQNFTQISERFLLEWNLDQQSLGQRLAPHLRKHFGESIGAIDQGLAELNRALDILDDFKNGVETHLPELEEILLDYFKLVCSGCAGLIEGLEKVGPNDFEPEIGDSSQIPVY